MLSRPALALIWGYQRFLSPRKGFGCAYRVAFGGTGCSGFAKHAIVQNGLWRAWPLIRQRFADCKVAAQTLQANANDRKRHRRRWYDYCDCSGCGGCADVSFCKSSTSHTADCTPDCTPDCCSF